MILKSTLIGATAIAIALTSFDLRPVAAAPQGGPAIAKQNVGADELSARASKRRHRGNPAIPLAAFGAIIGTIGAVAAANSRRDYYAPRYYEEPAYGYYGGGSRLPATRGRARITTSRRRCTSATTRPPARDYYGRWGGSGGQPGYRGPNVNVPGATNYGNAAGQNGQHPPPAPSRGAGRCHLRPIDQFGAAAFGPPFHFRGGRDSHPILRHKLTC